MFPSSASAPAGTNRPVAAAISSSAVVSDGVGGRRMVWDGTMHAASPRHASPGMLRIHVAGRGLPAKAFAPMPSQRSSLSPSVRQAAVVMPGRR